MIPRITVAEGYDIARVIKGGWHLAGDHGAIDPKQAQADMAAFVEAGITTFDCADIYTGVEQLIGDFRRSHPSLAKQVQVHTKFVPDLSGLTTLTPDAVESIIDRSIRRLGVEALDVVQFHWWDYEAPGHVEAALQLERLRRAGKIRNIGLTNFDTAHVAELVEAGVPIATIQIQYSLLDDRPNGGMVEYCAAHGISILSYGTVAGGFVAERWLGVLEQAGGFANRSLTKYKLIIEDFGGWALFQELLQALQRVAVRYGTDIATIASSVMLDRPEVAAVIVGATNTRHLESNRRLGEIHVSRDDLAEIEVVLRRRQGPVGEVYALERDRNGRHGRIMKYELNKFEPSP